MNQSHPGASIWLTLALLLISLSGCDLASASWSRPDVTGTWDLTYDDYLELEVHVGDDVHRQRVSSSGGTLRARLGGKEIYATVACALSEVLCPNELWPHQLTLNNRIGQVDGERFSIWLQGEGQGACRLGPGSLALAELETVGEPGESYEATMLSGGKITTELSADCLRSLGAGELPNGARVHVSAGFSAVRRAGATSSNSGPFAGSRVLSRAQAH
jgi:hypothetical protein